MSAPLGEPGRRCHRFHILYTKGTPIGYPCPFAKRMVELVKKDVGENVRIIDYTHEATPEK